MRRAYGIPCLPCIALECLFIVPTFLHQMAPASALSNELGKCTYVHTYTARTIKGPSQHKG